MNRLSTLIALLFVSLFLANCKKSTDAVSPADVPSQLARKWAFSEIFVQTDAKRYTIPPTNVQLASDDNLITILSGGTYTYVDNKVTKNGKWALSNNNQTLTLTDADADASSWQIVSLTSSTMELGTITVDLSKAKQTDEEAGVAFACGIALSTIDKKSGGTVDFTKEPTPKTVQLIVKAKAQ
ncbi:lipocalin family protein [Fibrella sp. HMF5335]|uniref:Lipocalin family protein n=1 Tax=Fibrella rubiginis TaxID=2817060 RepID=A0A939GLH6_9BACT|nr:lipocalin family protein [Fibrella rubiginis]MBO0938612.1 lipocalin family protein [Fibrella rubiginis]